MPIGVWNVWVLLKPLAAFASGGLLEAESGEPKLGVEEGASNGGVRNFLRFGGGKMECG